jgi:23S rRNA (guanosine2251-2'-O)-methyltransferase
VKNFRQKQYQQRPKKNLLIVGKDAIIKAIKSGEQIDKIYLQDTVRGEQIDEIRTLATQYIIPISRVPVEKLNGLNVSNHEGCIALKSKIAFQDVQDVISLVVENGEVPLLLILDGITDVRNIGAIARTAYCCGVHAIVIPDKGIAALNEDAILTSAGALEKIAICRVNSLVKTVDDLHLNGIKVYATEMTAKTSVTDINFTEPTAIVMGSEENGIFPTLLKVCDEQIKIAMKGDFESLNVSVATGMVLYEVMRQRN